MRRRISALTPSTAKGAAADMLAELVARHGQVGEMVTTMAHSPAVLGGYLQLSRALRRAKLDRALSERISLAVQQRQGCSVCLAAHAAAARALGIPDDEIDRARAGTSADPAVAAIVAFGLDVYTAPAQVSDEQIDTLHTYGFSDRMLADVVAVVALNLLTGAFNLVAGLTTEPDTAERPPQARATPVEPQAAHADR